MKHFYFCFLVVFLSVCCSKTEPLTGPDDDDPDATLEACFTLSSESILVGESLELSNCSEGATIYDYDFGNGAKSNDASPSVIYQESGEYTITLTVKNEDQESESVMLPVHVSSADSYYIFPEVPEGYSYLPVETGIHPLTGEIYSLELREDLAGPGGSKFFYRGLESSYASTSYYIADKPFNSNSAFLNVLSGGNQNFHFARTLAGLYGSQELTYNNIWGFISNINPANKHSYGYLSSGANFLYYGTANDSGTYKAAIEHRNSVGDTYEIQLFSIGETASMIGDMLKVDGGYAAYGGAFTINATAPQITGFKPMLAFFDSNLNLTSEVVLEESGLDAEISSPNDLNGSYHLVRLSGGNLVLYGNGELIVTNSTGEFIKRHFYNDSSPIQALAAIGDSFVISTNGYLRKFDGNGNQVMELKYPGNYLPEFIEKEGKLFIIAGFDTDEGIKMLYGAVDSNLTPVALGI
jgi:PKD repeat protein